ncbi:MAG: glycosyltransferase family 2 protein [Planctomycetes bacterium]|nr:glycosyltransferase family 2 protein [Planctomycetota bacterium]
MTQKPAIAPPGAGPVYSVVVPFYEEAESAEELYRRIVAVMDGLGKPYEMVFVDDGSRDATGEILARLAEADGRILLVELRRNFGQTAALAAGFDHASGEIIIAMDGDLQHAPEDIPLLLAPLAQGYDLVSGWRKHRVDNLFIRRIPSAAANWLMKKLSGVNIHDFGTTFKVYRRDLLQHIKLYGELHRFIPALASAVGAKICEVPIQNIVRPQGRSKYGLGRTVRVMMDLLTVRFLIKYFTKPLHFMGIPAITMFVLGAGIETFLFFEKLRHGWHAFHLMTERGPMLMTGVFMMMLSAVFLATGLLGELVVRTYYESQGKHVYYVRRIRRKDAAP